MHQKELSLSCTQSRFTRPGKTVVIGLCDIAYTRFSLYPLTMQTLLTENKHQQGSRQGCGLGQRRSREAPSGRQGQIITVRETESGTGGTPYSTGRMPAQGQIRPKLREKAPGASICWLLSFVARYNPVRRILARAAWDQPGPVRKRTACAI